MNSLTEKQRANIETLCRQFRVERLDLFGSRATQRFDPSGSDFDFIVTFYERATPGYADRYLDLAEGLESVLCQPVDLLTERSIRNPTFRDAVAATRQPVYDHRGQKATD